MAKILVVDDDAAILDLVGNVLNKDGHFVTKVKKKIKINTIIDFILKNNDQASMFDS